MAQLLDPPPSIGIAIGYSYTYRTYVFLRYRRVSRYTPPNLPFRSRGEGVAGGIAAQAALWGVSRYTGVSLR